MRVRSLCVSSVIFMASFCVRHAQTGIVFLNQLEKSLFTSFINVMDLVNVKEKQQFSGCSCTSHPGYGINRQE